LLFHFSSLYPSNGKLYILSNDDNILSGEYMATEYIPQISEIEREVVITLAEYGPKSGYDFHLGGQKQRGNRKALMSSGHWFTVRKHLGSSGENLLANVKPKGRLPKDNLGRRKNLLWLTSKGVIYALRLNVNLKRLLENTKKVYPNSSFLHVIIKLKQVLGEKAFNYCFGEAAKLEDFSEESLQRLSLTVATYGFMKAFELAPNRDPYALKRQIQNVLKEDPDIYELYKMLKKSLKPGLTVLLSD